MALPSQMPRSNESVPRLQNAAGSGRSGAGRIQLIGLGVVALVLVGVWWLWPTGPKTSNAADLNGVFEPASSRTPERAPATEPPPTQTTHATNAPTMTMERQADPATSPATQASPALAIEPVRTQELTNPATPAPAGTEPTAQPEPIVPVSPAVSAMDEGRRLLDRNEPVKARDVLNRALHDPAVSEAERVELRKRLSDIADMVTFSNRVFPGDPMADTYVVRSGDRLSKIPAAEGFRIDYRLLQRLNGIKNPNAINVGQKLKGLYGPFHAVVDKSEFRLDLYADQTDTAGNRLFIRSYRVGLGEFGSTPIGTWKVRPNSKLIDPKWVNPRTGEVFQAADPKNPIGERWIGLVGTDPQTSLLEGYGIHGTIDPDSIGKEMSMGCVRMRDDDVQWIYELLVDEMSTVRITP